MPFAVADSASNQIIKKIGPLKGGVRPFTINGSETLAFTTATGFLGFQVSDIFSGKVLYTVPVKGFTASGSTDAPSHGISLSPDEKEVYVIDTPNSYVHLPSLYNSREHLEIDWANASPVATTSRCGMLGKFNISNLGAVLRWNDTINWYKAYIDGNSLVIQEKFHGSYATLGATPFAAQGGRAYTLRFREVGSSLFAKVWQTDTAEPSNWMVSATNSDLQSGYCGLRLQEQPGITASVTSFRAIAA